MGADHAQLGSWKRCQNGRACCKKLQENLERIEKRTTFAASEGKSLPPMNTYYEFLQIVCLQSSARGLRTCQLTYEAD